MFRSLVAASNLEFPFGDEGGELLSPLVYLAYSEHVRVIREAAQILCARACLSTANGILLLYGATPTTSWLNEVDTLCGIERGRKSQRARALTLVTRSSPSPAFSSETLNSKTEGYDISLLRCLASFPSFSLPLHRPLNYVRLFTRLPKYVVAVKRILSGQVGFRLFVSQSIGRIGKGNQVIHMRRERLFAISVARRSKVSFFPCRPLL